MISALIATATVNNMVYAVNLVVDDKKNYDEFSLQLLDSEVACGDDFVVDLMFENTPKGGLNYLEFAISYDPEIIEVHEIVEGDVSATGATELEEELIPSFEPCFDIKLPNVHNLGDGLILVSWTTGLIESEYWVHDSGKFLSLKCTSLVEGETDIKVVPSKRPSLSNSAQIVDYTLFGRVELDNESSREYTPEFIDGTVTITAEKDDEPLWGDINLDGLISGTDATMLSKHLSLVEPLAGEQLNIADVTHDGQIDFDDFVKLKKYFVDSTIDLSKK